MSWEFLLWYSELMICLAFLVVGASWISDQAQWVQNPVLLQLWHIAPQAWEFPGATGAAKKGMKVFSISCEVKAQIFEYFYYLKNL